jgi:hypothetical protein
MKGHWFWGCALELAGERGQFLIDSHAEYGDVFISRALIRDLLFVRDPAVVNAINVIYWADFYKPDYIKRMWKPFLGEGLVPNDGESWKRQHKLIGLPQEARGCLRIDDGRFHRANARSLEGRRAQGHATRAQRARPRGRRRHVVRHRHW